VSLEKEPMDDKTPSIEKRVPRIAVPHMARGEVSGLDRTLPATSGAGELATVQEPDETTRGEGEVGLGRASPGGEPQGLTTIPRTTVLPRVTLVGEEPQLVREERARYEEERLLGQGGVGVVALALDNDIGRRVAIKRLRPGFDTPAIVSRFVDEVRTVGRLEHPNIVPIHDVGVDADGGLFFVMKYVEGETLKEIIGRLAAGDPEAHARFGFERRVQIFRKLLEAVAFTHEMGILHRDIKPANVLVGRRGEVMLTDFGIAKAKAEAVDRASSLIRSSSDEETADPLETRAGALIGTPAYMSPEQARGEPVDERSEVYSLSALFYELLTLRHPCGTWGSLPELLEAVVTKVPKFATRVRSPHQSKVPMELSWLLSKGLKKDPAARYASVAEMSALLDRRAEGRVPVQCPMTFMKRSSGEFFRFADRFPLPAMLLAAGALVGVLLALLH
jgi:eukaryotic-like serine/threonine-protein kinase